MIRGLWFFFQLAVLVLLAVWLAEQRGSVSVEWRGWLLETSPGALFVLIGLLAAALIVLWRLWRGLVTTPRLIGRFNRRRRRTRSSTALVRSLTAIASGEGEVALRHASQADALGEPALAHLAAADAAELAGDLARAETEYGRLRERPETALIGLRGLIGLAEKRSDYPAAIALARAARGLAPRSPWVAHRLYELEARTGAYSEAEKTLADAAKLGALPEGEADSLLAALLLARAQAADTSGNAKAALADATRAHELNPALAQAAILASQLFARAGRIPAAERALSESWAEAPDPTLARAWLALAPTGDTGAQLRQAERLHALDRTHPEGRLALAEAELAAGRWAEARQHLGQLGHLATRRYYRLMAYLENATGNASLAKSWFEKSLAAPPDPQSAPPAALTFEPAG